MPKLLKSMASFGVDGKLSRQGFTDFAMLEALCGVLKAVVIGPVPLLPRVRLALRVSGRG